MNQPMPSSQAGLFDIPAGVWVEIFQPDVPSEAKGTKKRKVSHRGDDEAPPTCHRSDHEGNTREQQTENCKIKHEVGDPCTIPAPT